MTAVGERLAALDWAAIERGLDERGYATTPALLTATECAELVRLFDDERRFRSTIEMERYRFGVGRYRYFAAPLPRVVSELRQHAYRHLAPVADRWARALGSGDRHPPELAGFLERCAAHGQRRPTPLLLRYGAGGYNCLHQDLYGRVAFPLQMTCVLSRRGVDYEGGELVLVEQRPRAQSRAEVITLERGEAIVFPNRYRPVAGARGTYRVNVRHGIGRVREGERLSLGIIFHDAE